MLRTRGGGSTTKTVTRPLKRKRYLAQPLQPKKAAGRRARQGASLDSEDYDEDMATSEEEIEEMEKPQSTSRKAQFARAAPTNYQRTTTKTPTATTAMTRTMTITKARSPPKKSTTAGARTAAPAPESDPTPTGSRIQVDLPKSAKDRLPSDSPSPAPEGGAPPPITTPPKRTSSANPVECDFEEWRDEWKAKWWWLKTNLAAAKLGGAAGKQPKVARTFLDHLCDELEDTECEHSTEIDNIASALTEINAFAGDVIRIKSSPLTDTLLRRLELLDTRINSVPAHGKCPSVEHAEDKAVPAAAGGPSDD